MKTVKIYDSNFNRIADINNYEFFEWVRMFRNPDEFTLHINRYKNINSFINGEMVAIPLIDILQKGNWVISNIGGLERAGRIEKINIQLTEKGKESETIIIRGFSASQVLKNRYIIEETTSGNGYDTQTTEIAETVLKHYVDQNTISASNANRSISNFVISSDLLRGNTISTRARFQKLDELAESICLSGDIGYETTFNLSTNNNEFDVIEGIDRTIEVNITTTTNNVKRIKFENSILDVLNFAYVAGQGIAENRVLREVFIDATEPSGFDRKEVFIDARDLTLNDELDDRGTAVLEDNKELLLLEFEYLESGLFQYLNDFDLGDIITVTYIGVATIQARITQVKESYLPKSGKTISIGLGRGFTDIYKIIKNELKNLKPSIRE